MDPMRFMEASDDMDIAVMRAIAEEAQEMREQMYQNLATMIANAVWGAVK